MYTDYGIAKVPSSERKLIPQIETTRKGAFGWYEAIRSDTRATLLYAHQDDIDKDWRANGFGVVLCQQMDGIARGNAALIALGTDDSKNLSMEDAAVNYSFSKGSSKQD